MWRILDFLLYQKVKDFDCDDHQKKEMSKYVEKLEIYLISEGHVDCQDGDIKQGIKVCQQ